MKTIIKGDTDDAEAELEITNEGFNNLNFVTLSITEGPEKEHLASIDVPIEDLSCAVRGFASYRKPVDN